jgi:hypothetical protein
VVVNAMVRVAHVPAPPAPSGPAYDAYAAQVRAEYRHVWAPLYWAARAAFLEQSVCALEAGRMLGRTAWGAFASVALPLARPAIAAGAPSPASSSSPTSRR